MHTATEFADEFHRLSRLLDGCLAMVKVQVHAYAEAEHIYRAAKAKAWVEAPRHVDEAKVTAGEREAWVNGETAAQREKRDIADGMRQAALEAVRARRGQISALQTLLNAHQEEAKFGRTTSWEAP